MESEVRGDPGYRAVRPRSHLFAVRLWKEDVAGGSVYRGSVRDVMSGAFRGFGEWSWSDLAAFLIESMEEGESAGAEEK